VALIVKTLSNPFFIAMGAAAKDEAAKKNVTLIYEAGKYDGDNATQMSMMDDLVTRGVKTIALVPNLSAGIVPAVKPRASRPVSRCWRSTRHSIRPI